MLELLVALVLDAFMNLFIDHHGKNLGLESFHAFLPTIPIFGSNIYGGTTKELQQIWTLLLVMLAIMCIPFGFAVSFALL